MLDLALQKRFGAPDAERKARQPLKQDDPALPLELDGRDDSLEFYSLGLQGRREYMEDQSCAALQLPGFERAALFGVFDGHGGSDVAKFVAKNLPSIIASKLRAGAADISATLVSSFALTDSLLQKAESRAHAFDIMGTTAVVTLVVREGEGLRLYCANAGDSRAVLCRGRQALDLSRDHRAEDPDERARIERAGCRVDHRGRIQLRGGDSGLNVSRALGDFAYKARRDLPTDKQTVIAIPEISVTDVQPVDSYLALASDGVFDVLSSEDLAAEIQEACRREQSMRQAARSILDKVVDSGDNVTLCLVRFQR